MMSDILVRAPYASVKDAQFEVAVLPWGATEAHNLHLPYGTDIIEAERIAAESVRLATERGARIIVLPVVPFGVNTGQLDIPLTINMNPSTQMALLEDVVASLERHGIKKLVILNSHGGNDFKQMIRELLPKHKMFICQVNWYKALDQKEFFDVADDHAGEMETSLMLHLAPELVMPLEQAGEGAEHKMKISAFREGWAWAPRHWTQATRDTGVGNPKSATAEKGKRYFGAVTEKVSALLNQIAMADLASLYE